MISPGWLFGLFEVCAFLSDFPMRSVWSVSSGARSLFMLPKIADKIGYKRIKKELGLSLETPRQLSDHWALFKLITNHSSYINDWYVDVLFFTDAWFSRPSSDSSWAVFYNYFFRKINLQFHYNRDDLAFNLTWKNLVYTIGERHLKPRPYILDTVKHLVAIGTGMAPAFCPADSSESLAPIALLQTIYTEVYDLKKYLPTIMHAHFLMKGQTIRPVYYSLSYPLLQESFSKNYPDIIADQREIKMLLETLATTLQNNRNYLPNDYNILSGKKYEFFHNNTDFLNEMLSPEKILLLDSSFEKEKTRFPDRVFCATSPFFSGCVRILTFHEPEGKESSSL